jgi:DNA polymerase-3 subunit epsilon
VCNSVGKTVLVAQCKGDRVVEIGCVELVNLVPTGETFHVYIDPERDMPDEAFRVHGLSGEFLKGKPRFADIAGAFLAFIGDAPLVAHNAAFDFGFINAELRLAGLEPLGADRIVDSLTIARRRFPGAAASLDALCQRFSIDTGRRTKHGALLDAELLAEVYAELVGARQGALLLEVAAVAGVVATVSARVTPLAPLITVQELEAHSQFIGTMGEKAIWRKYLGQEE